jgi:hypothetical protein
MPVSYEWRGEFTSALHAECSGHPVLGDDEWDWRGQVKRHSLGWVCARDGAELVGFVNVAWDGVVHAFVLDTMVAARARVAACRLRGPPARLLPHRLLFTPTNAGLIAL